MKTRHIAALKLLVTMFLVALVLTYAKKALSEVHFFTFIWLQMAFACAAIGVYYLVASHFNRDPSSIPLNALLREQKYRKALLLVISIGLINYLAIRWLAIFALQYLPVTTHAYLTNYVALVTMFFSVLFLKEFPSAKQWLGAVIAIIGLYSYFYQAPKAQEMIGIFAVGLTVAGLATSNILLRRLHLLKNNPFNHRQIALLAIGSGGLPLVLAGLVMDLPLATIGWENWLIILLNGLVANSLVMMVFSHAMQSLKAYEASLIAMSAVIFIALLAIPILGQVPALYQILGILLMLIGIYIVQRNASG